MNATEDTVYIIGIGYVKSGACGSHAGPHGHEALMGSTEMRLKDSALT